MPFVVEHLLEGRPEPVTAQPDEKVCEAIARMVEYDYSQLPVVAAGGKPIGMLTSDAIVRALNNFGATTDALRVYDAMVQIEDKQKFRADDDLFLMLDDLRDTYAIVIVDREGKLIGVVTTYDTTEYFRRRAEDMMLAREIEKLIKDYTLEAFKGSDGVVDQATLKVAIEDITSSNSDLLKQFKKAVKYYLDQSTGTASALDGKYIDDAFKLYLHEQQSAKDFDELTLGQFITLFLHKSRWPRYSSVFQVEPGFIRTLLETVRVTRNDLSHLREDITAQQRNALQFCTKWLARHEKALLEAFRGTQNDSPASSNAAANPPIPVITTTTLEAAPPEEVISPRDSRYTPLALYLQQQLLDHKQLQLTFTEIEKIIQDRLPESARSQRQFWANDSVGHTQSQQWLEAGWRVSTINLSEQKITFARLEERQRAYINFFSRLLADLRIIDDFPLLTGSPQGWHWHGLARIPDSGLMVGTLGFSFTIHRRARVELYIDTGDKERNKQIFDALYEHRGMIEATYGSLLTWERLDEKKACRIASYHRGVISDSDERLADLRLWAVDSVTKLYPILEQHVTLVRDMSQESDRDSSNSGENAAS